MCLRSLRDWKLDTYVTPNIDPKKDKKYILHYLIQHYKAFNACQYVSVLISRRPNSLYQPLDMLSIILDKGKRVL